MRESNELTMTPRFCLEPLELIVGNRYGEEQGLNWFEGEMAVHFFKFLLTYF